VMVMRMGGQDEVSGVSTSRGGGFGGVGLQVVLVVHACKPCTGGGWIRYSVLGSGGLSWGVRETPPSHDFWMSTLSFERLSLIVLTV
jgi:hypothetical protein